MTAPVSNPGVLRNFTRQDFPVFWSGCENRGPVKGAVKPMDEFPPDPAITAQNSTNAAKLVGLGYLPANGADPEWESMTNGMFAVGDFWFTWSEEDGRWYPGPQ